MTKAQQYVAALRSFLTTAVAALAGLLALAAALQAEFGVALPVSWIVAGTAALGLARTALAALDAGMPLFGRGTPAADLFVDEEPAGLEPLDVYEVTETIEGD